MSQVKIHGFAPSTYTRSVRIAALEKGVEYELVPLEYGKPSHLKLHPFGKMPILTHDGNTVYETLAIMSYLDANFEGLQLIPQKGPDQARTLLAASVAVDYAYRPLVQALLGDNAVSDSLSKELATLFDWFETVLRRHDYTAGPAFGAADILLAPMVSYHIGQVGKDHVTDGRPKFERWLAAVTGRPSFSATAPD